MTQEEQKELQRQAKIERLRMLQKQYRMLEKGASPEESLALKCEGAVLAKRLEVAQRGGR
jgi:hypothetical protein